MDVSQDDRREHRRQRGAEGGLHGLRGLEGRGDGQRHQGGAREAAARYVVEVLRLHFLQDLNPDSESPKG